MSYTPGPWISSGNRIYMGAAIEKREIAVATKSDPSIRHVAEANARLIAAAPDLLEALLSIEKTLCMPSRGHDIVKACGRALLDARAAIAKAKGEA